MNFINKIKSKYCRFKLNKYVNRIMTSSYSISITTNEIIMCARNIHLLTKENLITEQLNYYNWKDINFYNISGDEVFHRNLDVSILKQIIKYEERYETIITNENHNIIDINDFHITGHI